MITATDLGFRHPQQTEMVLREFSVNVEDNSAAAILGASGCGKSTFLRLAAGLLTASAGSVSAGSGRLSMMFQEPRLLPWRTVRENVVLPFELSRASAPDPDVWLERVGLGHAGGLFPHQLSGGMKQRAALARALIVHPSVLLLDEPFSAVDEQIREDLQALLRELWLSEKFTLLFVTHSVAEAVFLAQQILLMRNGRIAQTILNEPGRRDDYAKVQFVAEAIRGAR